MIQSRVRAEPVQSERRTRLRVCRAEHEPLDSRLQKRPHAHDAWLERHVQGAADAMIAQLAAEIDLESQKVLGPPDPDSPSESPPGSEATAG